MLCIVHYVFVGRERTLCIVHCALSSREREVYKVQGTLVGFVMWVVFCFRDPTEVRQEYWRALGRANILVSLPHTTPHAEIA